MKRILLLAPLLAACSPAKQEQPLQTSDAGQSGTWIGGGRDRMCIAKAGDGWRVGIVTYGEGNNNCTFRGNIVMAEHGIMVEALGDPACTFFIESNDEAGGVVSRLPSRLGHACDYYCGPNAKLAGKSFRPNPNASPAVDFAGDPLC